jgi:DamX protein
MQKPADNFTLQLLGASKEAGIQEFIEQNKLDNAYYYRTSHNGKDWFILVHGEYSSRDEAQSAIRELPLDLQELKPWARNYASVQKIIDKRK